MPSQGAALQVGDLENAVSRWAPLFVWGTVGAGSLVIALNVLDVAGAGNWTDLAPFLILAIVCISGENEQSFRSEPYSDFG